MTDLLQQLDRLAELREKATKGPWATHGPYEPGGYFNSGFIIETGYDVHEPEPEVGMFSGREALHGSGFGFEEADAAFIAAAGSLDFTALAAEVRRLREQQPIWPNSCPITNAPFFMAISSHDGGGVVPTYGGPYDSYTIPQRSSDGSYSRRRYDHDEGGWLVDETECVPIKVVHENILYELEDARDEALARVATLEAKARRLMEACRMLVNARSGPHGWVIGNVDVAANMAAAAMAGAGAK